MTTFTNPVTGQTIPVYVHEVFEQRGETWARVNKGEVQTAMVFKVRVSATNLVMA
jgi:hypothetical protein